MNQMVFAPKQMAKAQSAQQAPAEKVGNGNSTSQKMARAYDFGDTYSVPASIEYDPVTKTLKAVREDGKPRWSDRFLPPCPDEIGTRR